MSEFSFPLVYRQIDPIPADYISKDTAVFSVKYLYRGASNEFLYPFFNISNITDMSNMFYSATGMIAAPLLDTSKVTNMSYMFHGCSQLKTVPHFDTSKVTNMSYMFHGCSQLKTVPHFDTSKVTSMGYMFYNCSALQEIPLFDTSNVTSMYYAFYYCKMITLPAFNTSKVINMGYMLQNCSSLRTIPLLDCGSIDTGANMNLFGSNQMPKVTDLGGFKDLGKVSGFNKPSYFLKNCNNLTKESVLNVLNNLYDRAAAGYSVVTLPFHANALALLSDEEKAIATNKGWTLATS